MKSPRIYLPGTFLKRFWSRLIPFLTSLPYARIAKELARLTASVVIIWTSLHLYRYPDSDDARILYKIVATGGMMCIAYCVLFRATNIYLALLNGTTAYIAVLSLTGNLGDIILGTPGLAISLLFGLALTQFISSCAHASSSGGYLRESYAYGVRVASRVSIQDRLFIAAHEAGHVLVYAAFAEYPPELKVVAKSRDDNSGSLGYVNDGLRPHKLDEKIMAEWYMLLLLAGNAGERSYTGRETLGSSSDKSRWLKTADAYLSNLTRGIYHMFPKSKEETEHNEAKLMVLKDEQQLLLDRFFEMNRKVHNDLVKELISASVLKGEKLFACLDRVVLPDNFPRPQAALTKES
ncbi:TPA: hypothetical protein ND512_005158 [Klebsiella pneumoniae]|nr:hypothetical protein [Klebsiella pneumoniae]